MQCPKRLTDPVAREFFATHAPILREEMTLTRKTRDAFAVLCQTYADYIAATDIRGKKVFGTMFFQMAKSWGLIPHASKTKSTADATSAYAPERELDDLFSGDE